MSKKKVLLLIQSGYSARNFILSGFTDHPDFEFIFWSDQDYIKEYNLDNEYVRLPEFDYQSKANFLRRVKNRAEIYLNVKKTQNKNYLSYLVTLKNKRSLKSKLTATLIHWMAKWYANEKGIQKLDIPFYKATRKTSYYQKCKEQLLSVQPDVVLCTHQRASTAVAPMLAARDLGLKTICFVHSWDNVPKGVQLVKADKYFVWSKYMKNEMLFHYPFFKEDDIYITGTPQFLLYFQKRFRLERNTFLQQFNLDTSKKYILFSGNDRTSSPNDPKYLALVCDALRTINAKENDQYRILFRPNPIDRNNDFDAVLSSCQDIVTELKPSWFGAEKFLWNQGGPSEKDITLLMNSILHVEFVINVGSTMAIDAAILGKATCWINFEVENQFDWSVRRAYNYIHFQIIKGIAPVFWINSIAEIESVLKKALDNPDATLIDRNQWVNKVVQNPIEETNNRMWNYIKSIHEV